MTARRYGHSLEYFAGVPKLWCVCTAADEEVMKAIMLHHDIAIQYTRGTRYVGRYIGSDDMEEGWIDLQITKWVEGVKMLSKVAL